MRIIKNSTKNLIRKIMINLKMKNSMRIAKNIINNYIPIPMKNINSKSSISKKIHSKYTH